MFLFSFSIVLSLGLTALACGWYYDERYSNSNFAPEIFVNNDFSPMFYCYDSFFYDKALGNHNTYFKDDISEVWQEYLAGISNQETIEEILFNEKNYSLKRIENIAFKELSENLPMTNVKFRTFMQYMYVARSVEQRSTSEAYSWNNNSEQEDVDFKTMYTLAFALYNSAKDEIIKQKSYLLIMKMYFYFFNEMSTDQQEQCISLYEKISPKAPKNKDYYRILGYVAGVNYRQKNYITSNYLYSKIFLSSPILQKSAIFSYHPLSYDDVKNKLIPQCISNEEKCAVWTLQGFYVQEPQSMLEIANIDINSKFLPLLMSRAINKEEKKIISLNTDTTLLANIKDQYEDVDDHEVVYPIIKQISETKGLKNVFTWQTALGYMEMLYNHHSEAEKCFNLALQNAPNTSEAKGQIRVLKLLNKLNQIDKISPNCFDEIDHEIYWLLCELKTSSAEIKALGELSKRIDNAQIFVRNYLTLLYQEDGNSSMAAMFKNSNSWEYGWAVNKLLDKTNGVDNILALLKKDKPNIMEQSAIYVGGLTEQDIYKYKNIQAIFSNRLSDVLNISDFDFPANPFNGSIIDNHDAEHKKGKNYKFKKMFETMQLMQASIERGEEVYNNALLLGNAFYSISHFGNCRLTSKLTGSFSTPDLYRSSMEKMMTDCSTAAKYYQMAHDAANNDEERAKCAYMLAKCERNNYYNKYKAHGWHSETKYNMVGWTGFKLLNEKYADTQYFKEVINECGYFKLYNLAPEVYNVRPN